MKAKEKELDFPHRQAYKGNVHRTMLTAHCVLQWAEITLEPDGEVGQIFYQAYPTKTD